jgi:broad specificity phosphatase PhoE
MKRVYLIRHGQTVGNLGKFFQFPDTELSEAGLHGAQAVADRFKTIRIDKIFASHYTRAQQTAGYISEVSNIPIETLESLHEKKHADSILGLKHDSTQGTAYIELHKEKYWTKGWNEDNAENYYDVINRVAKCVQVLEDSTDENIIVVSHANFIKAISAYMMVSNSSDLASNRVIYEGLMKMSNVGITEFVYDDNRWRLLHWNDHAHFAE